MNTILKTTIAAITVAFTLPLQASIHEDHSFLKKVKKHYEANEINKSEALTFINEEQFNIPEGKEFVQIMIMRHGKPLVNKKKRYSWKEAEGYTKAYDSVGVEAFSPDKIVIPEGIDTIYTSNLGRSINTAEYISAGKIPLSSDEKFREFERQVLRISHLKMPLAFWSISARIPWVFGAGKIESLSTAKKRSDEVAGFLEEKAMEKKKVLIVAHDFLNRFTGKRLKKDGWVLVRNGGHDFLAASLYVKLVDKKQRPIDENLVRAVE